MVLLHAATALHSAVQPVANACFQSGSPAIWPGVLPALQSLKPAGVGQVLEQACKADSSASIRCLALQVITS